MRGNWRLRGLGVLVTLAALAVLTAHPGRVASQPSDGLADLDAGYVVVQYASLRVAAQRADGLAPSLQDQGFRSVRVPPGRDPEAFAAELRADPDALSATIDARVYAQQLPNDPSYFSAQSSYMAAINAPGAWDLATGSEKVTLAVLDTGLDIAHPEFAGRLWTNTHEVPGDGIDNDANGCLDDINGCRFQLFDNERATGCGYTSSAATGQVADDHGKPGASNHSHGTISSGIAAAAGNDGKGVAGIGWNLRVMSVKVLDCGVFGSLPNGFTSELARGIDYARLMGADIISLSVATKPGDLAGDQPVLRKALQDAEDAGVLVVAAAGNHPVSDTTNVAPGYPAAYTQFANLVAVGAATNAGAWAPFSNYGPAIDFAAPGVKIAGPTRTAISPVNPYGTADGTSFATPLVAGMFALMLSRNSSLQFQEMIDIARGAATPAAPAPHGQPWAGAGIINIGAAVARVPFTAVGDALHDWKDVPNGTVIRALVNGNDCGAATAANITQVARYSIRVKAEAEQPGCGAPGATVQMLVANQPAIPTFTWGERDQDLATFKGDISSVTPPPGQIVVQQLAGGWSSLANLEPSGLLPSAVSSIATPWTTLLRWDPAAGGEDGPGAFLRFVKDVPGYVNSLPASQQYSALWVDSAAGTVATANPNPGPGRAISLQPGWNNIVYTGASRELKEALSSIDGQYTQVLSYENATGAWLSHLPGQRRALQGFNALHRLRVYWILVPQPATLVMN